MRRRVVIGLLALVALLAGCGSGGDFIQVPAKTRPAQLFETPPAGLVYKLPDKATLSQITKLVAASDVIRGDDLAVRQVVQKGSATPAGFVLVVDAHSTASADGVARGFAEEARAQTGKSPRTVKVAGNDVSLAEYQGVKLGGTTANGYMLAAAALDEAGVRVLLARLIFAARAAER